MKTIEQDKEYIVSVAKKLGFENKSFLITGATGMIGRILVNSLLDITSPSKIYVLGLNQKETEDVFCNTSVIKTDFQHLDDISGSVDYIIHLASPTNSKYLKEKPVETISFIYESTKQMLDFSLEHNSKVLYVSSMETYGEVKDDSLRNENDLGYVSLANTRNSYPEAKRLCELLCYSYSKEFNLDVCSVRLAQTFGAGTKNDDPRIFGYIGRCVLNNENIVLNTKGDSFGNYCYIADTLTSFMYVLANGVSGETYNVVGDDCRCTILDLANLAAHQIANDEIKVELNLSNSGQYPNPTKLNMSNNKLKSIGWEPKYKIIDMLNRMISSWEE